MICAWDYKCGRKRKAELNQARIYRVGVMVKVRSVTEAKNREV